MDPIKALDVVLTLTVANGQCQALCSVRGRKEGKNASEQVSTEQVGRGSRDALPAQQQEPV